MEKEITPKIKAKVFAQYFGRIIKLHCGAIHVDGNFLNEIESGLLQSAKLTLKPLWAITDEDENELSNIIGTLSPQSAINGFMNKQTYLCKVLDSAFAYQYLQSRGYDLPNYLLGGKTLREAGLAIYSQSEGTK